MLNRYVAYGLIVGSTLELPELQKSSDFEGSYDIFIREGDVDLDVQGEAFGRCHVAWLTPEHFWFRAEDGTHYDVRNGRDITVMVQPGYDPATTRLFLLGSVFAAMLLQRGLLVLHGNAIRVGDECLVCLGESGVGKSTLAAAFLKRGFDILADDVVAIDRSGCAVSSFPRLKLWKDAVDKLGFPTHKLSRVKEGLDKFSLPISGHDPQLRLPIRWTYELAIRDELSSSRIERMAGMYCFNALRRHTYRSEYLLDGMLTRHLKQCSEFANRVHFSKAVRPRTGVSPDMLVDLLLEDLARNSDLLT